MKNLKSLNLNIYFFLKEFKSFAEKVTFESGKSKNGKSGKASSYYRHLIRLVIGYEQNTNDKIENLYCDESLDKLEKFINTPTFIKFNKDTGYFYSAAISNYRKFLEK